jgi:hypothetical protein
MGFDLTNKASPMPIGAIKVALCFSAASKRIANMSLVKSAYIPWYQVVTDNAVRNISMKRPWATVVPPPKVVRTLSVLGVMTWMIAAPCAMIRKEA